MYKLENDLKEKGLEVNEPVWIKTIDVREAKTGSKYGIGTLIIKGGKKFNYKIWDQNILNTVKEALNADGPLIINIIGLTDVYNNAFSVIINKVSNPTEEVHFNDYLDNKYEVTELMQRISGVYKKEVSEKGQQLISKILSGETAKRFVEEFAAVKMHDAVKNGLLAHTTKMMEISALVKQQHKGLFKSQNDIDLFFIGVLFHDIGKIDEYMFGTSTKISFVTHQYLGTEYIREHKDEIIKLYSEDWYYQLVAILLQHHGIYDMRPKTVFAYLVHLVDNFEASLTILEEDVESNDDVVKKQLDKEYVYLVQPLNN